MHDAEFSNPDGYDHEVYQSPHDWLGAFAAKTIVEAMGISATVGIAEVGHEVVYGDFFSPNHSVISSVVFFPFLFRSLRRLYEGHSHRAAGN